MTGRIDLSTLPAPNVIEAISYEQIVLDMKAAVAAAMPEMAPVLALESEPAVKVIEVCAMFVMITRARVNDGARAVMLAYATGADLENLAAIYGVSRQIIDDGDPTASPPVPPTYEDDESLRFRTQLAPESFTAAGARNAYLYHALSAGGAVRDALVESPEPGEVVVTILSQEGNGAASPALVADVEAALSADDVRPLCDLVTVQSASIIEFSLVASLEVYPGPDPSIVVQEAEAALVAYLDSCRRVGRAVRRSGIFAALHRPGVGKVVLSTPAADIEPSTFQSAYCTGFTVTATTSE